MLAVFGDLAGARLALHHAEPVAGLRRRLEAEHLDRRRGAGLAHLLAVIVDQRAHAAPFGAGHDDVADMQRAALHQHGRDRPAAAVELRLDDDALRRAVGIGLQVEHLRLQQDRFQQLVEVGVLQRRDLDLERVAAHRFHHDLVAQQLGPDAARIGALLVDLVDRDDDRHAGGAGVIDRFHRLRHHAVVGGDDQDRDVGRLRAAGAHGGEGLVARRVDEGDLLAVLLDLIGADMLGDAAGLGGDDIGLADGVEKRGLAVVDVAHDGDDRRTRLQRLLGIGLVEKPLLDVGRGDAADVVAHLLGHDLRRVGVEHVGDLHQLAVFHQQADHVDGALRHAVGELLHGDRLGDHHVADDLLLRRREAVQPGAAASRACGVTEASERSRSLSDALKRVGDGQPAAPALAARRGLGAGRLRHFKPLRARSAAAGTCGGAAVGRLGARGAGAASSPSRRRASSSPRRRACSSDCLRASSSAWRRSASARSRAAASSSSARRRASILGLLALLGLADARLGERMGARVALLVGQRAQHDAARARTRRGCAGGLAIGLARLTRGRAGSAAAGASSAAGAGIPAARPARRRDAASSRPRPPSSGRRRSSGARCRCRASARAACARHAQRLVLTRRITHPSDPKGSAARFSACAIARAIVALEADGRFHETSASRALKHGSMYHIWPADCQTQFRRAEEADNRQRNASSPKRRCSACRILRTPSSAASEAITSAASALARNRRLHLGEAGEQRRRPCAPGRAGRAPSSLSRAAT